MSNTLCFFAVPLYKLHYEINKYLIPGLDWIGLDCDLCKGVYTTPKMGVVIDEHIRKVSKLSHLKNQ